MKRLALLAVACAFSGRVWAQDPPPGPVVPKPATPPAASPATEPKQDTPLQPKPFAPPPAKTESLPAPQTPIKNLEIIRSGRTRRMGQVVTLSDGVEILYGGYRIFADEVEGNLGSRIFTISGNVKLIGEDSVVTGDTVIVDFERGTYNAINAETQIPPSFTNGQATGNLYLDAKQSFGSQRRLESKECEFTTCNLTTPHWHLDAKSSVIEPGKQAIFRNVKLNLLGRDILYLPVLWIPLGNRTYKYLPQVGQTPDEGYYIKNRYGFPLRGEDIGAVRVDYMQKLGTGLGADYLYRNKDLNGAARIYSIFGDQNTTTFNLQHEQRFKIGTLTLDQDVQQNNYLTAPGSSLVNTRAQFQFRPDGNNRTTLGFLNQANTTSGSSSQNQSITLNDARTLGKLQTNLDLTYAKATNSFGSTASGRETLDVRFRGNQDLKQATATLEYQRTIPIGEIQNFFAGSDRTPVLSLASDSTRLLGKKADQFIPFRTEISLGEYLDPVAQSRFGRGSWDLNFNRPNKDKGPWRLDLNGRFRQTFYTDDTAQYVLNGGAAVTYQIGQNLSANLRYSYLRPYGYSPLVIDRTGITNVTTFDVTARPSKEVNLGLQTGYDIQRLSQGDVPWQQVGVRAEYAVGNAFSLRTLTTYDTFQGAWSNVRVDSTWRWGDANVALGARYDGIRGVWSNANLFADGLESGKTRLGALLAFNGFSGRLESQQYNLIYDLHCFEAVLTVSDFGTGFRSGREISFFVRLKAFPIDSNFGFGRRGQPLGTGTGRDF